MNWARSALLPWAVAMSWGCGSAELSDIPTENEELGSTQQAVVFKRCKSLCVDYKTADGRVWVRIYYTGYQGRGPKLENYAEIDADEFVLVGGGAEIYGEEEPGALLTASYPIYAGKDEYGTPYYGGWAVASKDHLQPNNHLLKAYAIGLRLEGYTAQQLRQQVKTVTVNSGSASGVVYADADAPSDLPWDHIMLGGGARAWQAVTTPAGRLLVGSHARGPRGPWRATAKDHFMVDSSWTQTWMIYMPERPPGLGYGLALDWDVVWSSTGGGYRTASVTATGSGVPVGVEGRPDDQNSSPGRLLTDMYPFTDGRVGATVTNKDHYSPDSGRVMAGIRTLRAVD